MLVKRDNPISRPFDAAPNADDTDSLWMEDGEVPLPPAVEPSGYRPAPKGIFDSTEESAIEASVSGMPTPRALWTTEPLTGSTPLPVVTATTEPTQRGLGIPPPPSAKEATWLQEMPSFTSMPPLSLDTFDERAARARAAARAAAASGSERSSMEPTENERITVRAPAVRGMTARQRNQAVAAALLVAAALFLGLFARRATVAPERVSAAAVPVSERTGADAPRPPMPAPAPRPAPARGDALSAGALASAQPPSTVAVMEGANAEQAPEDSSRETRREKRRRARAERAAHAPSTPDVVATNSSENAAAQTEAAPSRPRRMLSLPPR
jgi:hypothetical protein